MPGENQIPLLIRRTIMLRIHTIVFAIGLMLICQVSVSYAENLYLSIPGIQGEATEPNHIGWMVMDTATWGHGEAPPGSPAQIQFGRVHFTKRSDSTSAALALLGANGQPLKDVKFESVRTSSSALQTTFRMKLTNARVTTYAASTNGSMATENLALGFDTITWITFKTNPQGQMVPGSAACWDIVKNVSCVPQY
jgi:type VI protein secretion system component Hcp